MKDIAKGFLDRADNLGKVSSDAKESFSKINASKDTTGADQQLKVLLEGVEKTEKELSELGIKVYEMMNMALLHKGDSAKEKISWYLTALLSVITVGSLVERLGFTKEITPESVNAIVTSLESLQKSVDELRKAVGEIRSQQPRDGVLTV